MLFEAGIRETSNKYHNKIYDDHVKFYLLLLKEELNLSCRNLIKTINKLNVTRNLGLKKIPHFTTLQKFLQRIGEEKLRELISAFRKLIKPEKLLIADLPASK